MLVKLYLIHNTEETLPVY